MKIFDFLFRKSDLREEKKRLLLQSPKDQYKDKIKSSEIESIINNMPADLTKIERAYYVYLKLGQMLKENPEFFSVEDKRRTEIYDNEINAENEGICKSISELYVAILRDKRVNVKAKMVRMHEDSPISHIDVVVNADGKKFITNLISDLYRIKTGSKIMNFGFDLEHMPVSQNEQVEDYLYLRRINRHLGKLDVIPREQIEQMDKKFGYSYVPPTEKFEGRGIYAEDTIELLRKEFENEDSEEFKQYVLKGQEVDEDDVLIYKAKYIMENIKKLIEFSGNINYRDINHIYQRVVTKVLNKDELRRIEWFEDYVGKNYGDRLSIVKIKPTKAGREKGKRSVFYKKLKNQIEYTPASIEEFTRVMVDNGISPEPYQVTHIVNFYENDMPDRDD